MPEWWEPRAQAWRKQFLSRVQGAKTPKLEKWLEGLRKTLPLYQAQAGRQDRAADTGLTQVERMREEAQMIIEELAMRSPK